MYSCPGETSTGTMWPGSLVAKASSPGMPKARYSVIKIELPIQESSPASEMMDSLGSRANSRTGMVVPVMRLCMCGSPLNQVGSLGRTTRFDLGESESIQRVNRSRPTHRFCALSTKAYFGNLDAIVLLGLP